MNSVLGHDSAQKATLGWGQYFDIKHIKKSVVQGHQLFLIYIKCENWFGKMLHSALHYRNILIYNYQVYKTYRTNNTALLKIVILFNHTSIYTYDRNLNSIKLNLWYSSNTNFTNVLNSNLSQIFNRVWY